MPSDKRALAQLEHRLRDAGYVLRYERGHFRPGACLVHERRVVVVNRFFDPAARLEALRAIAAGLPDLDPASDTQGESPGRTASTTPAATPDITAAADPTPPPAPISAA